MGAVNSSGWVTIGINLSHLVQDAVQSLPPGAWLFQAGSSACWDPHLDMPLAWLVRQCSGVV